MYSVMDDWRLAENCPGPLYMPDMKARLARSSCTNKDQEKAPQTTK